jgi:hypothetical protein
MIQNTPFDYVWLGLLIGVFDLGSGGMSQLREKCEEMGLTATLDRLPPGSDQYNEANIESDDIVRWVAEELATKGINSPYAPGVEVYNSTDLINSLRPGVWGSVPQNAQNDLIEADKCFRAGHFNAGARLLVGALELMMKHFYSTVHPVPDAQTSWSQMEDDLFKLNDRELYSVLYLVKGFRIDYRNPTTHGDKAYDQYEAVALWHMAVNAVTRMANVLERRTSLPGRE